MSKYFNAFNQIQNVGPQRFKKLLEHFSSLEEAWNAPLSGLKAALRDAKRPADGEKIALIIAERRKKINPDAEMEKLTKSGVEIITLADKNYPKLLREIPNAPAIIYLKGNDIFSPAGKTLKPAIGIVGARKFTSYGKEAAEKISRELAQNGIIVVSGLALGIDALAHRSCVEGGSETIAVLGSGLNKIYPSSNAPLAKKIIEGGGCLISEYPLNMPAQKQNFPQRNRIISGLSLGIVVIEARAKSGALITAEFALEQNREIFAVPGSIFSKTSGGANNLIKSGARLITCAEDILSELNIEPAAKTAAKKYRPQTAEEKIILETIEKESGEDGAHIDKIIKISKLNPANVSAALSMLELNKAVKNIGGKNYILNCEF